MSRETREWLSTNTLIGFTEKRGNAWHYREGDGNHYVGGVPIEDVRRRLFDWEPEERPLFVGTNTIRDNQRVMAKVENSKAIVRSDTGTVLGVFSQGYCPHDYNEWLLTNIGGILGTSSGDLGIGSAGLLEGGAVAWVQVEMPETVKTAEGVQFRPWLNAFSSLNGKFATTYKTGITDVVCDNTMRAAQGEHSEQFKVRSTARSLGKLAEAREALGLVFAVADDFEQHIAQMCAQQFSNRKFELLMRELVPIEQDMKPVAVTNATKKRDALMGLWLNDRRVAPWTGTAWGAFQAFNTYGQHLGRVVGGNRPLSNMKRSLSGKIDEADADVLDRIAALV
jgi:phage/plasmid-like protein (TIGR03299 family)